MLEFTEVASCSLPGRAHGSIPFGGRGMKTASPLAARARACLSTFIFQWSWGEETTLLFTNAENFLFGKGMSSLDEIEAARKIIGFILFITLPHGSV